MNLEGYQCVAELQSPLFNAPPTYSAIEPMAHKQTPEHSSFVFEIYSPDLLISRKYKTRFQPVKSGLLFFHEGLMYSSPTKRQVQ
jgi:hypothetical protein